MEKENHIFQGLRRDNHQIRQKPEFLWDALNIRITNRDDSTLFSITNEKGTSSSLVSFPESKYVGHCVLGRYLVVFTEENDACTIYRIEKKEGAFNTVILFRSSNKLWSADNPIQTLGSYETDLVQKVYWIDGEHQPRVINITLPELKKIKFKEKEDITEKLGLKDTSFDFVQTLKLEEEVTVTKQYGNGMFAPGVIQYAFTYYNKYGQESNIFYTTPLQYITYQNRGGSPDDRINVSFKINIDKVDDFDYIRIYSIHRTSLDAVPTVKLVSEVEITDDSVEFIDTGMIGEIVDNSFLLYVGGRDIIPQCMTVKDNTLFLGNIKLNEDENFISIKESIKSGVTLVDCTDSNISSEYKDSKGTYYSYDIHPESRGFKSNEYYRLGIQLQKNNGSWTEPIYITDDILNASVPYINDTLSLWSTKKVILSEELKKILSNEGYRKIRTCVVFPNINDRTVICQGVICPTVFSTIGRPENSPYVMSSWFFRPGSQSTLSNDNTNRRLGSDIQYVHNKSLLGDGNTGGEIQGTGTDSYIDIFNVGNRDKNYFFVDENVVTMHSPDIEFDDLIHNIDTYNDYKLRILGFVSLGASVGDINIDTKSARAGVLASGFLHSYQGYEVGQPNGYANGGLIAGGFYNDAIIETEDGKIKNPDAYSKYCDYFVYPFNRSGSLNNDRSRTESEGERTSVLSKKVISNLKYFNKYTPIEATELTEFDIKNPQLFSSDEVKLIKIWNSYLEKEISYYGNIDTVITAKKDYDLYYIKDSEINRFKEDFDHVDNKGPIYTSNDPIRMKYKSTPHLVFSLGKKGSTDIFLPPISELNGIKVRDTYNIPEWDESSNTPSTNEWDNPLDICVIGNALKQGTFKAGKYTIRQYNGLTMFAINRSIYTYPYYVDDSLVTNKTVVKNAIVRIKGDGSVFAELGNSLIDDSDIYDIEEIPDIVSSYPSRKAGYYKGEDKYFKIVSTTSHEHTYDSIELEPFTIPSTEADTGTRGEEDSVFKVKRYEVPSSVYNSKSPYLCLAELVREVPEDIRFGGKSDYILKSHIWYPTSKAIDIDEGEVPFLYGDTWYQRYDCLKTYPYTSEDENQIVEIGSFMCETRINIDGRYDRNRGQISNLNMTPLNFNLFNEVYNQKDSFFDYRILDEDFYKSDRYANQVTWTLEKSAGAVTDNWTNITLANVLDMDGSKGEVTSLNVWNDNLLCLQERQFSQILFNSRVQIPVSDGVPIEIGNGQKVEGTRAISDSVGCKSKFSTLTTSNGFYFLDKNTDGLYLFNGQLSNITDATGMSWWTKRYHDFDVRLFNDRTYNDVYLVTDDIALCFSEKLGQFTSQMSYGGVSSMFNIEDRFYSFKDSNLYMNNDGKYNDFYGNPEPWYISFISNANPTMTKVFDTIDLRMDILDKEGNLIYDREYKSPINFIHVDNEYQTADSIIPNETSLRNKNMMKKFRIWRGLIPRNNGTRQRIRNPWTMIRLGYNPIGDVNKNDIKSIIHDVSVNYSL